MTVAKKAVERLPPRDPNERWAKTRCEGEVSDPVRKWAELHGRTARCSFRASYLVAGRPLCDRHAGKALLKLMLSEDCPGLGGGPG